MVVNKIFWASQNEKGELFEPYKVESANTRLERLYEIVEHETPSVAWIEYGSDLLVADSKHKWGPSPFHFGENFYRSQLSQIEDIIQKHKI